MTGINLDAILGEIADRPLTLKGETFMLPGELPAAALAGFIDPDVGLVSLITEVFSEEDTFESLVDAALEFLKKRPSLISDLLGAAKQCLDSLLGEQAAAFYALNPSINAYFALAKNLLSEYGSSLTDFFESAESSEPTGTNSSLTSPTTTPDLTPEVSGVAPVIPASSDSVVSVPSSLDSPTTL